MSTYTYKYKGYSFPYNTEMRGLIIAQESNNNDMKKMVEVCIGKELSLSPPEGSEYQTWNLKVQTCYYTGKYQIMYQNIYLCFIYTTYEGKFEAYVGLSGNHNSMAYFNAWKVMEGKKPNDSSFYTWVDENGVTYGTDDERVTLIGWEKKQQSDQWYFKLPLKSAFLEGKHSEMIPDIDTNQEMPAVVKPVLYTFYEIK